jgi:hypothetical protein
MKIISLTDFGFKGNETYDLVITAAANEERSFSIILKYGIRGSVNLVISNENPGSAEKGMPGNFQAIAVNDFARLLHQEFAEHEGCLRVLFDVSCIQRPAMAEVFHALVELAGIEEFELTFAYSLAAFSEPPNELSANEEIEPVHIKCSGWPSIQSAPTSLIVGLGYELHKAEGASEFLDPSDSWAFVPVSPIEDYLTVVRRNNSGLLERLEQQNRVLAYHVDQPAKTFGQLEIIISDLLRSSNPVLLPFGPKIFFAVCLLHGLRYPEIGIWHVTGENTGPIVKSTPSGIEIAFKVNLLK